MAELKWYENSGDMEDIAVSTRIRLARNVADIPFPGHMTMQQQEKVVAGAAGAMPESMGYSPISIDRLNELESTSLVERHIISAELAKGEGPRAVILSGDEGISVMVNEEDHFRIQVVGVGLCLSECMERAETVDNLLEKQFKFAFSEELGYLTHCPTNIGTGLRASVMLHLPALTETGNIKRLVDSVSKLGFTVRGFFGEGSSARGALYQVSNQLTLGITEAEAIGRLDDAVKNIITQEQTLRDRLMSENAVLMEDRIWRAAGVLATARRLTTDEAMNLLSGIRMGAATGILRGIDVKTLNSLLWQIQPSTLTINSEGGLTPQARDIRRAELIRRHIRPLI